MDLAEIAKIGRESAAMVEETFLSDEGFEKLLVEQHESEKLIGEEKDKTASPTPEFSVAPPEIVVEEEVPSVQTIEAAVQITEARFKWKKQQHLSLLHMKALLRI
ncbi:hypothetical protein ACLOJK_040468 [Asimina triloba]